MKRSRSTIPMALLFTVLLTAPAWAVTARRPDAAAAQKAAVPSTYRVKKGDSLYTIARRKGLSVEELKSLNGLKSNALKPGQVLVLGRERPAGAETVARQKHTSTAAATSPSPARPKPSAGRSAPAPTYRVKKGDSLSTIARRNGLSVKELKRLNGLKSNALKPGQKLVLSRPAASSPMPEALMAGPNPGELLRQEAAEQLRQDEELLPSPLSLDAASPDALEEVAYAYLSTPYRFGGSSRRGIDCSSFVQSVFRELKIDLPRTAREQFRLGTAVASDNLQSGDLLFFRTYAKYPSHVGIYLGDHKMIHASPRSRRVVITDMTTPYFRSRFIGAKRLALLGDALNLEALAKGVEEERETDLTAEGEPEPTVGGN